MTFTVDAREAREALGAHKTTWGRWTSHLKSDRTFHGRWGGGGSTPKQFRLSDLVVVLRTKRARGLTGEELRAIVALNKIEPPTVPVEGDHVALTRCLTRAEFERFALIQRRFGPAMASVFFDRYLFVDADDMKARLILNGAVLAHVLTKTREHLPYTDAGWTDFAAAFVTANSPPEVIRRLNQPYHTTIKELQSV